VSRELIQAEVPHEIVHLRRSIDDAVELPDVLGVHPAACVAVHLYDTDAGLVAALVPAHCAVATTALARAARVRAIRALEPHEVSAVTDYQPSLVAPVGLPAGARTVADSGLRTPPVVYAPTGDGGTALKIRTGDLLALTGAEVFALVEPGGLLDRTGQLPAGPLAALR
jgi:prolyl-tRNA editing enzyme YbaK/EbsC (Cys-tRNA(Pro) deacylase)